MAHQRRQQSVRPAEPLRLQHTLGEAGQGDAHIRDQAVAACQGKRQHKGRGGGSQKSSTRGGEEGSNTSVIKPLPTARQNATQGEGRRVAHIGDLKPCRLPGKRHGNGNGKEEGRSSEEGRRHVGNRSITFCT